MASKITKALPKQQSNQKQEKSQYKWIKMAIISLFLIVASSIFGYICRLLAQTDNQLYTSTLMPLWYFLAFLIALHILLIIASLVATLFRPIWFNILIFFLSAITIYLSKGIDIISLLLSLLYFIACVLFVLLVKHRLALLIKFSSHTVAKTQKIVSLALILLVTSSLFVSLNYQIKQYSYTVPEEYVESFLMTPIEQQIQGQFQVEGLEETRAELKTELTNNINTFLNDKIKPYQNIISIILIFNILIWLIIIVRITTYIAEIFLYLTFVFLKLIGVTKIITENKPVERLVIK